MNNKIAWLRRSRVGLCICLGLLTVLALNRAWTQETAAGQRPTSTAPVPPMLANVHRIVCLGDSITQGGEGPGGYVWLTRHYLQALYPQQNITIINAGISVTNPQTCWRGINGTCWTNRPTW